MPTECNLELFDFARVEGRAVVAAFDGGRITSDAGALLLGATDRVIGLTRRLAACFTDGRNPKLIEHDVATLVMQRVVGIALGYEDLIDHDELRHDPVMAVLAGKLAARRSDCAPLAGKSTLNRLELSRPEPSRYAKLAANTDSMEAVFVDLFLDAHKKPPAQITLDLDATDDPLHGQSYGQSWCLASCGGVVLELLKGFAVAEAHALDHLGEALGAVQPAPVPLGRLGELEDHGECGLA
jgi:hypothetical protein